MTTIRKNRQHQDNPGKNKTHTATLFAVLLSLCLPVGQSAAASPEASEDEGCTVESQAAPSHASDTPTPAPSPESGNRTPARADRGWTLSLGGGTLMGQGTFRSFGSDATHIGYGLTLSGGYRFNPLVALELSATLGSIVLTTMDCCPYWLSADLERYFTPPLGEAGWYYTDLESQVCLQRYALQADFNLAPLLLRGCGSPWTLNLSPRISAVSTTATLSGPRSGDGSLLEKGYGRQWHLGLGGELSASRRLTDALDLGVYVGMDCLTGGRLDRIPVHCHKSNFVFDAGLRLSWNIFGKSATHNGSLDE